MPQLASFGGLHSHDLGEGVHGGSTHMRFAHFGRTAVYGAMREYFSKAGSNRRCAYKAQPSRVYAGYFVFVRP
ncbi:MAG: hypothetical protein RIQ60_3150 [Pseudomonadota bacterium]